MNRSVLLSLLSFCLGFCHAQTSVHTISSPNKNIVVSCDIGKAEYSISYKNENVLKNSKLGVTRDDEDFSQNLQLIKVTPPVLVKDTYSLLTAKKKFITYVAIQRTFQTKTASGKKMNVTFRVSDDGV